MAFRDRLQGLKKYQPPTLILRTLLGCAVVILVFIACSSIIWSGIECTEDSIPAIYYSEHCITLRGQKWKVSPESTGYNPTIEDIRRDQISRMNNFVKWGLSGCSNQ
eukprot:TRINITY_DN41368_c0_g1_i1.p1 TRINITY_DN41368_c0_g1~~TRINITY_DN41368_c0_g1_i1.p1  ORF type:complete len:107 (+),score=13.88 TRINITY_DN41368_c0_g1_i1:145-465(+)